MLPPIPSPRSVEELETLLSEPTEAVVEAFRRLEGDLLLLGVGGKMGPSLARMARRASDAAGVARRILGVSRFGSGSVAQRLQAWGIETVTADLLDPRQVQGLPDFPNVLYLVGMKFGATGQEALTWAMNSYLPGLIGRKFARSRILAFSTGNVYGLTPVAGGGSRESDDLRPLGDYAMSCVGRERVFEYFSRAEGIPMALIRLNYACELRYGVLVDIAQAVWAGEPVDLTMGYFNVLWQGDANAMTLQIWTHAATPPTVLNLTGPELLRVRDVADEFGRLWRRPVAFTGAEADTALLSNSSRAREWFGPPQIDARHLIHWVANWVAGGGATLGKPTHFATRDGNF